MHFALEDSDEKKKSGVSRSKSAHGFKKDIKIIFKEGDRIQQARLEEESPDRRVIRN